MDDLNKYDSYEFVELLLLHLYKSKEINDKAKKLGFSSSDFEMVTIYAVFAEIFLTAKDHPISEEVIKLCLREKFHTGVLNKQTDMDPVIRLLKWFLETEANQINFISDELKGYRLWRRLKAIHSQHKHDLIEIWHEGMKLGHNFDLSNIEEKSMSYKPFQQLYKKTYSTMVPTGIKAVDRVIRGLGYGQYNLLMGFSGGGKTALASCIAYNASIQEYNVMYFSLEEPGYDVLNRFYARHFKINYSDLHQGNANFELEQKFNLMTPDEKDLLKNFRIEDIRDLAPVTPTTIRQYIQQVYDKEKYHPDLVIVDQMDYLDSSAENEEVTQKWQKYEAISFELDKLSEFKVGGSHPYALLVLHQAKGKLKKSFTNEEISGFKGIIKPADCAFGIGRESTTTNKFCFFSLKSRHSKNFEVDIDGNLEYMDFSNISPMVTPNLLLENKANETS